MAKVYPRDKCLFVLLFILAVYMSTINNLIISKDGLEVIITCFSVIFGFYLTAISTLFGSQFTQRLKNEPDKIIKTQTKLQTLIKYFRLTSFILIIGIIFLISIFPVIEDSNVEILKVKMLISSIAYGLMSISILSICFVINILFNAFGEG